MKINKENNVAKMKWQAMACGGGSGSAKIMAISEKWHLAK
jgi:hypothetical protein